MNVSIVRNVVTYGCMSKGILGDLRCTNFSKKLQV